MTQAYNGIVPYLFFDQAETALDWYSTHFGSEEINRWTDEHGAVRNAEMKVGSTEIWLDGTGRFAKEDPRPLWFGIWVDDVDAVYQRLVRLGVGCEAPVDREFGVRMLNVDDGMGYLWGFMKRISNVDG